MYRDGGFPATQPLYLDVRYGTDIYLYLSDRGECRTANTAIKALKRQLREWKFTAKPIRYSLAVYGTHDVICLHLPVSDRRNEDRKLTDKQVRKLRKLANPWCKARGTVAITTIYQDTSHLNTEVSITVTDGHVRFTYAPPLTDIEYPVLEKDGAFTFLLATPVGKNAEDPVQAATIVAEEFGIYLPERPHPRSFKRRNLIEQTP